MFFKMTHIESITTIINLNYGFVLCRELRVFELLDLVL